MKILGVHSALSKDVNKQSQVDHWRIYRPLRELAKHTDWQIDHQPTFIKDIEKYKKFEDFTEEELQKALEHIMKYDIVFSSYHADPGAYTLLKVANKRAGTRFVMDIDDNIFSVNEDNPFWVKMDDKKAWMLQVMVRENPWICTTTEDLASEFRDRRSKDPDNHKEESTIVIPNYISNDYKAKTVNHKNRIVIGYFGGSSHYTDLHETNVAEALKQIMHDHKNVYFKAVGMPLDKYVPRGRYEFVEGKRGNKWLSEVFPTLDMDIALAPLDNNTFNLGKSDIKWQEATRAGAAVIASDVGPYSKLPKGVVKLTENTYTSWYLSLKKMVEDVSFRNKTLNNAQAELKKRRLEDNWTKYKEMFEYVKANS